MRERITSRQNPRVIAACGLLDKKQRKKTGLFRFDGVKLLREALAVDTELVTVYVREPMAEETEAILQKAFDLGRLCEEQIVFVTDSVFDKLSEEKNPEGVLCVARQMTELHRFADADCEIAAIAPKERLLLVEAMRDPGNLGTVMRSCAALGIDRLILTDDCADLYHPKTLRGAMGAVFRLPTLTVASDRMPQAIVRLRASGRRVYATALHEDALTIGAMALGQGDCFVIGNEGHGLSQQTVEACTASAVIPMREGNESLNAAVAAAICIWETVKCSQSES